MPSVQIFAFNNSIAKELKERLVSRDDQNRLVYFEAPLKFTPSTYQQRIFDWVAKGRGSALVKAVAGSGKTTTIMNCLRYIPWIEAKDCNASTFHSAGFNAICRHLNRKAPQMVTDGSKMRKIAREALSDVELSMYSDFCTRLVGLAKGEGIGPLPPDVPEAWYKIIQHHDLYLESEDANETRAIEIARDLLARSNAAALRCHIDFDDMLYLPLVWRLRLWMNDWVFIDEAQDTNPVRRAIAKLALKPGGRLVAVGDPKQAIYGFTGASTDAMDLIQHEFNCVELPLTVSYRCPKLIAERVKPIVPYFEVPENAVEGEVRECKIAEAVQVLDAHDAIVCRQTAPLIALAFHLIAQNIGCTVLGRDIAAGLISLIEKQKAKGIENLIDKLEAFREREVARFTAKGEENKAEAINDRVMCIMTVIANLAETTRTVPALIAKLQGMFTDENGVLSLATVHKVKGREYQRVAILSPELMPSKWARQDWQHEQEMNLIYVANTRSKHTLLILTDAAKQN